MYITPIDSSILIHTNEPKTESPPKMLPKSKVYHPSNPMCIYQTLSRTPFHLSLRSRTPRAKFRSTPTVVSQSMQASVMLTPFFRPARPPLVTFWLPAPRFDSSITPTIPFSPAHSWSAMALATRGWFLWSLRELPGRGVSVGE